MKNNQITPLIMKTVDAFGCSAVDGVVSHQIKRFSVDGTKVITNKTVPGHQVRVMSCVWERSLMSNAGYDDVVQVCLGSGWWRENEVDSLFRV